MPLLPLLLAMACTHRDIPLETLAGACTPEDGAVVARWDGGRLTWGDVGEARAPLEEMRQVYLAEAQEDVLEAIRTRTRTALLEAEVQRRGLEDLDALRKDLVREIQVTDVELGQWKAENDWGDRLEGKVVEDRVENVFVREAAVDPAQVQAWVDAHPGSDPWMALVALLADRLGVTPQDVAVLRNAEPELDETAARLRLVQQEAGRRAAIASEDAVTKDEIDAFLVAHPEYGDEGLREQIRAQQAQERLSDLADRLWIELDARLAVAIPEPDRVVVPEDGNPAWGPVAAPVTLVVFSDFQCPYCARLYGTLQDLRARYGGRIRIVFRDAPLAFHPRALAAAAAASCAAAQGRHEAMQGMLFENPQAVEDQDLERYAALLDLDVPAWRACTSDPATRREIELDLEVADRVGVQGVPTVFVNGIRVAGARPFEDFTEVIDRELAR